MGGGIAYEKVPNNVETITNNKVPQLRLSIYAGLCNSKLGNLTNSNI